MKLAENENATKVRLMKVKDMVLRGRARVQVFVASGKKKRQRLAGSGGALSFGMHLQPRQGGR
jgi:hypothetical protein